MNIPLYQVDAFTAGLFGGNPAAVCLIDRALPDALMQNIASENNLSETAFVIKEDGRYRIRWFTPVSEVDLCGHATLAASHVLFHHREGHGDRIEYLSRSGILTAARTPGGITLDFPADLIEQSTLPDGLVTALGSAAPAEVWKGKTDYLLVYSSEEEILGMEPDFHRLKQLPCRGIIVTAPGRECDFVSRFFAPLEGINEDPVTGSAHTTLAPYWAPRLGKNDFAARQLSKRRGELAVCLRGSRVEISGRAVTFMTGGIEIPESMLR